MNKSFTLVYPENEAFVCKKSHLPERLMIVDGAYRAFQMPFLWLLAVIVIPFFLGAGFLSLADAINSWGLPQIARLVRFFGFAILGLATLNMLLPIYNTPVLFNWIEKLWAKSRASRIIQYGGEIVDGWVISVEKKDDEDGDCWCIKFKISQDSNPNVYSITMSFLPDHLSNLEHGSILKVLKYRNYLYLL